MKKFLIAVLDLSCSNCGGSDSTSTSNPNQPNGFTLPIISGPHFQGTNTFTVKGCAKAFIPNNASTNDINLTINQISTDQLLFSNIPFPWSQGFNTASEIYQFNSVSAFNGYPIWSLNSPATVQLCYTSSNSPQNLRLANFNEATNRWTLLPNNTVLDQVNKTVSNTTNFLGYFAVVYPTYQITKPTIEREVVPVKNRTLPNPKPKPVSIPIPKSCFLWWCW